MTRYMLDTNIISYLVRGSNEHVLARFREHEADDLCVSVIVYSELCYGTEHSSNPTRNRAALSLFLSCVDILPFNEDCAEAYGRIRQYLAARGALIGGNDMLIAAHAITAEAVLVTHNVREFARVEGLRVEDWCEG